MSESVSKKLRTIMLKENLSIAELARKTHQTPQNLSNKLSRDNFTLCELNRLSEGLGYTVEIVFKPKKR